jgi:DNA-binding XRE family transcriptional regulator
MTPARIRKIRKALGFSQEDFAHILWVTWTTVNRWETGAAKPYGLHLRVLQLLESQLSTHRFRASLQDPRSGDPMFLLYRLLQPLYKENVITARDPHPRSKTRAKS